MTASTKRWAAFSRTWWAWQSVSPPVTHGFVSRQKTGDWYWRAGAESGHAATPQQAAAAMQAALEAQHA